MNIVKSLRRNAGMQQKELAIMVGVTQATVSEWEHGKKDPTGERLKKLAEIFGVEPGEVLGDTPYKQRSANSAYIRIPVLGRIPAGVPFEMIEDIEDYEDIPATMARGDKEYFALKVRGDSMNPKYEDGDTIILRATNACENGQDCAVRVDGNDATFKRVYGMSGGGMILQPLNPNPIYKTMTFTPEQVANLPVVVLGVVVELRRKI